VGKKMIKPTKTALSIFLILSSSSAWADNLLDVYNLAKDGDPTFLASEAGTRATSERVNQSMATLLPQLSARANYRVSSGTSSRLTTGVFTPVSTSQDPNPDDVDIYSPSSGEDDSTSSGYTISLTQEIYNHASWLGLRQSEKRALQSKVNHEGSRQDLIVRVAEAYFNVLAAQDSVAFSKAETEAVSKELAQTNQRFEVGLIAQTDVHEAQSRHDRAIANQISAQNTLDNMHEALQLITGQYHYDLLGLKPEIPLRNPQPSNIKDWVKESESNNITINAAKIGLDIAKKSISISQAGHLPTLNLSAEYSESSSDTDSSGPSFVNGVVTGNSIANTDTDSGPDTAVVLSLNIPLYSGGRTNSQVKESQNLYLQAAHNLEADHRRAVSQTRSSYLGVVAAVSSVKALKQAVVSSQSALEATQAGFEVGTRTIVDVLLQTQQLFESKRQHARARYDYILNTLRLKQATGLLTEKDLAQVNQMLR
jgi:outer membrane protein